MTGYEWLKLFHILAVIVWVGGVLLVTMLGLKTATSASREERIVFTRQSQFAGMVFTISGLVTLAFGTWMVIDQEAWGFDQMWVSLGFLGVLVGAALGMGFYGPQGRKLLTELEADDPAADARAKRLGMVGLLESILLVVVVWAMVAKPGL